jgi:hypothetical protein
MGIRLIMISLSEHIIFIGSPDAGRHSDRLCGVLVDPSRSLDFPEGGWDGWALAGEPRQAHFQRATVDSITSPDRSCLVSVAGERAERLRSLCLAGVQNCITLTYPEELRGLTGPYFISSDWSLEAEAYEAEVELLLERLSDFPDFRGMVAFDRWLTRRLSGDPDVGNLFASTDEDSLSKTGQSMHAAAGLLLPFELGCSRKLIYGVLALQDSGRPGKFRCVLYMSEKSECLRPGIILRRRIRFEEDGREHSYSAEIARVLSVCGRARLQGTFRGR